MRSAVVGSPASIQNTWFRGGGWLCRLVRAHMPGQAVGGRPASLTAPWSLTGGKRTWCGQPNSVAIDPKPSTPYAVRAVGATSRWRSVRKVLGCGIDHEGKGDWGHRHTVFRQHVFYFRHRYPVFHSQNRPNGLERHVAPGLGNFKAVPSHAIILCVIYPVLGLVLFGIVLGYSVLPCSFRWPPVLR